MSKYNASKRQRIELYKQDIEKLIHIKEIYGLKSLNATASFCIEIINDFWINNLDPISIKNEKLQKDKLTR
ncbi:MAG: hypothetical protein LBF00_03045 [Mycoplasmataceae bacterium]|nr:hypothetical protein [Mycoplasmataceae bacterium]